MMTKIHKKFKILLIIVGVFFICSVITTILLGNFLPNKTAALICTTIISCINAVIGIGALLFTVYSSSKSDEILLGVKENSEEILDYIRSDHKEDYCDNPDFESKLERFKKDLKTIDQLL